MNDDDFTKLANAGVGAEVMADGPGGERIHGYIVAIDYAARTVTVGPHVLVFPPLEEAK